MASPSISTQRLTLRPFQDADLEAMVAIYGREDVSRYLDWGPRSPDDIREWLSRITRMTDLTPRGDALRLAALLKGSETLIGDFSCGARAGTICRARSASRSTLTTRARAMGSRQPPSCCAWGLSGLASTASPANATPAT